MSEQRRPMSRALKALITLVAVVAVLAIALTLLVGVVCGNETGFSCGG